MRATIDDVARAAGVSLATVSRALRGLPNVAPGTRERVQKVATDLDYRPNRSASSLAAGSTGTIGLLTPGLHSWYGGRVLAGVESVLSEEDYDLLVKVVVRDRPTAFVDTVRSLVKRVDGLVLIDLHLDEEEVDQLRLLFGAVVTLGARTPLFDSIVVDNQESAAAIARYLTRLGHTKIAAIDGEPDLHIEYSSSFDRAKGLRVGLAEAGLEPHAVDYGGFTTEGGVEAATRLLGMEDPPTAIFAFSDEMAFGALKAARQLGVDVPKELSVVGFDDHDLSGFLDVTTVRQDVAGLGAAAARRVVARLKGSENVLHDVAPISLVVRGSSGPAPGSKGGH